MSSLHISDIVTASMQDSSDSGSNWLVYGLFLIAGLFVGGAWSAYKSENTLLAVVAGVIAVVAAGGGVFWMIGEMT